MNARCSAVERMASLQQHVSVQCRVVMLWCYVEHVWRVVKQCVHAVFEDLRRAAFATFSRG